ncbi:hypothetical protein RQP46_011058 [Phenoliferia psychrophenolica]
MTPFSRSAAKRQSVMALGSIKHLQHQFIKAGLSGPSSSSSRAASGGSNSGNFAPGSMAEEPEELDDTSSLSSPTTAGEMSKRKSRIPLLGMSLSRVQGLRDEDADLLPPSPAKPVVDPRMPWEKEGERGRAVKDEKELRADVLASLEDVCERWGLITSLSYHPLRRRSSRSSYSEHDAQRLSQRSPEPPTRPTSSLSVQSSSSTDELHRPPSLILELLQTTTSAIRNVQLYVVSLPADAFVLRPTSSSTPASPSPPSQSLDVFLPTPSTPPRSASPLSPTSTTTPPLLAAAPPSAESTNPLVALRHASLAVLGSLKSLETSYRIPVSSSTTPSDPPSSDPLPSSSSEPSTPTSSSEDAAAGFEYQPCTLTDLSSEASIVRSYIETVDRVLFRERESPSSSRRRGSLRIGGDDGDGRKKFGHRRSRKVEKKDWSEDGEEGDKTGDPGVPSVVVEPQEKEGVEGGELEEEGDDGGSESGGSSEDDVPDWAMMDPGLPRTHLVLETFLPAPFTDRLSPATSRNLFLESLSDGTLLCHAYNAALRASSKPFGFIGDKNIHDLAPLSTPDVDLRKSIAAGGSGDKEKERVGATFRRVENLRVWSACVLSSTPSLPSLSF